MGFANIYIMNHILNWVKEESIYLNIRKTAAPIIILNLLISAIAYYFSRGAISACIVGLTLSLFLDLTVTQRILTYRKHGGVLLRKSIWLRIIASILVLLGFFAVLRIDSSLLGLAIAAPVGSSLSLIVLRKTKWTK